MAELKIDLGEILRKAGCTQALIDVAKERVRQVSEEGWTPEHDDTHTNGALLQAAIAYAADVQGWWPFGAGFKPKTERENLIRAGALLLAEIERLDRLNAKADSNG